jgi:DNA-binding response OmpR family regulator
LASNTQYLLVWLRNSTAQKEMRVEVLIVEDNEDLIENLYSFLEPRGYQLDCGRSGYAGLALVADNTYDAIILDVMLPGIDGYSLCKKIRHELRVKTPVLMLTAKDSIENRVQGFDSGADDYLIKPFSLVELDARIKALVRRVKNRFESNELVLGGLRYDLNTYHATRDGVAIVLTPIGHKLLSILMQESPRVLSREELERHVWGDNQPNSDALRTHIHTLRQSLDKPFNWNMLVNVPGLGYQLVCHVE